MINSKPVGIFLSLLLSVTLISSAHAYDITSARVDIAARYVEDLGNANAPDIISLFEENGTVVSTSKGRMKANEFFNAFLPEIASASTKVKSTFTGLSDPNRFVVRFHFTYQLKDGEKGEGEYIDEFIFVNNSLKLEEVVMFENTRL